jgi:hypothetical protein
MQGERNVLVNVEYERSERQYRVMDPNTGEVETFPNGYKGRREAMRRAVYFQNPRLHRIVIELTQRWPQLESRAWRAAELVLRGSVTEAAGSEVLATVTSSNEYGEYLLADRNQIIVCDCLDYLDGNAPYIGPAGQRMCKHILALQFNRRLRYRRCGSCSRKVEAEAMTCPNCQGAVTPY